MRRLVMAVVWVMLAGAASEARADVPPMEGQHVRASTHVVDLGRYGHVLPQTHTIGKGDTLRAIAKARLGSADRWKEVLEANPGVDPQRLLVGKTLQIPPRMQPLAPDQPERAEGPVHRWHFFLFETGWSSVRPLEEDGRVASRYRSCWLFAVRDDHLATFKKRMETQPNGWLYPFVVGPEAKPLEGMAVSRVVGSRGHVSGDDPVHSSEERHRIVAIADGLIRTERLGYAEHAADGRVLDPAKVADTKKTRDGVLLLLGLLGLAGLLRVAWRRRAVPAAA